MEHLTINKYVKTSLKVLGIILLLVIVLLIIASVYIHFNKDQIIAKIKTQISHAIKGEIIIKDIDVTLLSSFPYAAINIKDASILDSQYHKPLLTAKIASCRVNIFQLLYTQPDISKVVITDGSFHFFTDTAGYSNSYIFSKKDSLKSTNTPSSTIRKVELKNFDVLIEDAIKEKRYALNIKQLNAAIDKDDSLLLIKLQEQIFVKGLGFNLERGNYLENQTIEANNWRIRLNTLTQDLSFGKTRIDINEHIYNLEGRFHFKDSSWFQLHVTTKAVAYKQAAALLTKRIQKKLNRVGLSKSLDIEADIRGRMAPKNNPYVLAKWITRDNEFTTPIISFNDCSFSGIYNNRMVDSLPVSDKNSEIVLSNFKSYWKGVELSTDKIRLFNLDSAIIQFNFQTRCDFKTLDEQLALESIDLTGGSAQVSLQYDGPLIVSPALLSGITANMQLQNVSLLYQPRNITFTNCSGNVSISGSNITVNNLQCDVGQNHFKVDIAGNNMNRITLNDPGKSFITCNVFTPSVDLNDFRSVFTTRKSGSKRKNKSRLVATAGKIDDLLENGDLQLNVQARHVELEHFTADNVQAQLLFQQDDWEIQQASLQHAGGRLSVAGRIHQVNDNYHKASAKFILQNVDVRKVFYAFDNFGQDGITYNNLRGSMNASADINLGLDNSGRLSPNSIQGIIYFSIKKGALINYTPLRPIQDYAFVNRDLNNIEFAELQDSLIVKDNQVQIKRMEIASTAINMYVEGVYGIKRNTDISIQIPISNLKKQDSAYHPQNKGVDAKVGMSIYLRAKTGEDGRVKIKLESIFKRHRKNKKE